MWVNLFALISFGRYNFLHDEDKTWNQHATGPKVNWNLHMIQWKWNQSWRGFAPWNGGLNWNWLIQDLLQKSICNQLQNCLVNGFLVWSVFSHSESASKSIQFISGENNVRNAQSLENEKKLHKYVNKRSEFYLVKQVNVESWLIWSSSCCLLEQNRVYGSSKTFLVFLKINPIGFIGSIHKCTNLIVIISNEYYQTFYPCLKGMMAFLQHIIVSLWNIHGDTLIPCQELLECFHLWLIRFWYQVASQIGGVKHDYCHTENGP